MTIVAIRLAAMGTIVEEILHAWRNQLLLGGTREMAGAMERGHTRQTRALEDRPRTGLQAALAPHGVAAMILIEKLRETCMVRKGVGKAAARWCGANTIAH